MRLFFVVILGLSCFGSQVEAETGSGIGSNLDLVNDWIRDCYYLDDSGIKQLQDASRSFNFDDRTAIYNTYSAYGPDGFFAKARLKALPKYWLTPRRMYYWTTGVLLVSGGVVADYYSASHDDEAKITNPVLFGAALGLILGGIAYLIVDGSAITRDEDNRLRSSLRLDDQDVK